MSVQELVALYRLACKSGCPSCRKIISFYEKNLKISDADRRHLEACILNTN
ncbi:MAG: hypothetical protein HQM08_23840 [Candidatus Riflebacteria bacterium]|nr:hypothetical protein [Candidatus Riflebacteria bacterium]